MTVSNVCMGWLRLVGSIELSVSFAEYRLFYRALLQKRRIILRSLLIEATPYEHQDSEFKADRYTDMGWIRSVGSLKL